MGKHIDFKDILVPRKTQFGIVKYMTRDWNPQRTLNLNKIYAAQDIKRLTAKSAYLDAIIEAESINTGISKEKLKQEVQQYLDEMGLDKKMHIIRWMGVVFLKLAFMMKIGIYVNDPPMLKLKESMGKNPVIFLPTHRSYADFCLMTYLCYHYDIDFPAVAAGMDFYSMAVFGHLLRGTGAFYLRRTFVGSPLYAATFSQYVRTLITKYGSPVEFFVEGTRSRSNKSLPPKFGVISMCLLPYFAREVSDITIVPVNISYDRLIEHGLFAYEHLGVPKPKESTGRLLKALKTLNDNFGNIYINLGSPLSVKSYLKDTFQTEMLKPLEMQQLTSEQFKQVQEIAEYVVSLQQENTIVTITNLIAIVLMECVLNNRKKDLPEVLQEIEWLIGVLNKLGASVFVDDVAASVKNILVVHKSMMTLDKEKKLRLVCSPLMDVSAEVKSKMKGHTLKAETMVNAVPIIQLQLYVNPVLYYLVPPAIVCSIVRRRGPVSQEQLAQDYHDIRILFRHEFFYINKNEEDTYKNAVDYCVENRVIVKDTHSYLDNANVEDRLSCLLQRSVLPAFTTMKVCCEVLSQQKDWEHKEALKLVQECVESSQCHPYCLSLESIANCLQGLVIVGALTKDRGQDLCYHVVPDVLEESQRLVASVLPNFTVDFARTNSVVLDPRVVSRL